jgi:hypothetical protein
LDELVTDHLIFFSGNCQSGCAGHRLNVFQFLVKKL